MTTRKRQLPEAAAEDRSLSSFEEFRASLAYFFMLFGRDFPQQLQEEARAQWAKLGALDAVCVEDGQNNPLVELKLDSSFGVALCSALAGPDGELPSLRVPRTDSQLAFWNSEAPVNGTSSDAIEVLSEATSHLKTISGALSWYSSSRQDESMRVFILGASERYEYGVVGEGQQFSGEHLGEQLAQMSGVAAPGQRCEFILCGRDVPARMHRCEQRLSGESVVVRHYVGYLHDLIKDGTVDQSTLKGALFIGLHCGIGLDHPELADSWPPTLAQLRTAAPVWLAMSSFNPVEHEAAQRSLRASLRMQLALDRAGVNEAGSLSGLEVIGPFDGLQGKRNYCILHARIMPEHASEDQGWDLFD